LGLALTAAPQLVRRVCASWFEVRALKRGGVLKYIITLLRPGAVAVA
jgi:hypothetical protein